ncbi:MAG: hypothetical protein U1E65_00545 [Myxococcota bacterium]
MIDAHVVQNVRNALQQLQAERALIERKIAALNELLATSPAPVKRGPGRPRKVPAAAPAAAAKAAPAAKPAAKKVRAKAKWSPAARKAARERMKKYWAKKKKAK